MDQASVECGSLFATDEGQNLRGPPMTEFRLISAEGA
jgi:hypothetical protein